jgi:hypothetical protein
VHILQELLTVFVLLIIFAFGAGFFLVRSDD